MKLHRLLPGSMTDDGGVIDYRGEKSHAGPCFIPFPLKPARLQLLGENGWCKTPAKDWPSILPRQGVACIHRELP